MKTKLFSIVLLVVAMFALSACAKYSIVAEDGTTVASIDTNVLANSIPGVSVPTGEATAEPTDEATAEPTGEATAEPTDEGAIQSDTYFREYSCSDLASCPIKEVPEGVFIVGYPKGCEEFVVFMPGEELIFANLAEIHAYKLDIMKMPRFNLRAFVDSQKQDVYACYASPMIATPTP